MLHKTTHRLGNLLTTDNGVVLIMIAVLFWAGNFVMGRIAVDYIPPVALAFYRWICAGLIALAVAWPNIKKDWPVIRVNWQWLTILGISGIGIYNTFVYIGVHSTTVLNTLILNASLPVVVAVMSWIFFREQLKGKQTFGLLMALAGVIYVIIKGQIATLLSITLNVGDFWVLSGVASYAIYTVFLRKRPQINGMSFIAVTFLIGAVFLFPFYVAEHMSGAMPVWQAPQTWGILLYVIIFPSLLSYICFNRGVAILGATRASTLLLTAPIWGAILALMFLGEQLTWVHLVGALLIFSGLVVGRR